MTTALFYLRCYELGIGVQDQDELTIGLIMDMITERTNDDYPYQQLADQSDFDAF